MQFENRSGPCLTADVPEPELYLINLPSPHRLISYFLLVYNFCASVELQQLPVLAPFCLPFYFQYNSKS